MEIGDTVKIVNPGKVYSTYRKLFLKLGFKNKDNNFYKEKYNIGIIFNKTVEDGKSLYAIRFPDETEILISSYGLKFISSEIAKQDKKILLLAN